MKYHGKNERPTFFSYGDKVVDLDGIEWAVAGTKGDPFRNPWLQVLLKKDHTDPKEEPVWVWSFEIRPRKP
jgi:hypothetical protein